MRWIAFLLLTVSASTADLGTDLRQAALQGNVDEVRALLTKAAPVNAADRSQTALMIASMKPQRFRIVQALLEAGADRNLRDKAGHTALMHAAAAGNEEIIRLLLLSGADPLESLVVL